MHHEPVVLAWSRISCSVPKVPATMWTRTSDRALSVCRTDDGLNHEIFARVIYELSVSKRSCHASHKATHVQMKLQEPRGVGNSMSNAAG